MAAPHRISVEPARLAGWLDDFAQRHGRPDYSVDSDRLVLHAPDGAEALITPIWGSLSAPDPVAQLLAELGRTRRLGALLCRKAGHAIGVFDGTNLVAHALGRHHVQGRTKAGGWSQQRYARRRDNQANRAFGKAADAAADLLLPRLDGLDGLLLGGDSHAVRTVLADPRLAPLAALAEVTRWRMIPCPDPNLRVLRESLARFNAVPISLNEAARSSSLLAQQHDQAGQHG